MRELAHGVLLSYNNLYELSEAPLVWIEYDTSKLEIGVKNQI